MRTVLFAGPSIIHMDRGLLRGIELAGPVRRGDLGGYAAFDTFVIIDGEFGQCLSVSPKEILALLDKRKLVIGASSMGALRASELADYGMVGVGWVYDQFVRGPVRRDDDVALTYSPIDYSPLTVPMVDIVYWMECLLRNAAVTRVESSRIVKIARRFFFADRTKERLWSAWENEIGTSRLREILCETAGKIPDIKALDATRAISLVAAGDAISLLERQS